MARAGTTDPQSLSGTSAPPVTSQPSPDRAQSAWLRQTVIFEATTESVLTEAFHDAEVQQPMFTYSGTGPYRVIGPSGAIDGALDPKLENTRSAMTIFVDAPEIRASIGMAACPLSIGAAVDMPDCVSGPPFSVTRWADLFVAMVDQDG